MARLEVRSGLSDFCESGNQYTGGKDPAVGKKQSKRQVIEESGFSKTQVQRFEELASHPEIVEQAIAEA